MAEERKARRIVLSDVKKRFGDVLALDRINFIVEHSKVGCIVGPSGCGKTTILNMLAGFEREYEGTAEVGGMGIKGPGPDRTVVFQQDALFPWLTVYKNVVAGISRKNLAAGAAARAKDLLNIVGLVVDTNETELTRARDAFGDVFCATALVAVRYRACQRHFRTGYSDFDVRCIDAPVVFQAIIHILADAIS